MVLKRRFFCVLILMLALSVPARAETIPDCVRLHVVADGDDDASQALKLRVRDACLERARAMLSDCESADAAWAAVNEGLESIGEAALAEARSCDWQGDVRAETGVFDFPDRQYGDVVLPAGRYRALRVVIGSGEGRNWWCVLYPSLCVPGDWRPGEPVRFYSSILRWLRGLLGAKP